MNGQAGPADYCLVIVRLVSLLFFIGKFPRNFRIQLVARAQVTGLALLRLSCFQAPGLGGRRGDLAPAFQRVIGRQIQLARFLLAAG